MDRGATGQLDMTDERTVTELLSLANDLELTDGERLRLALILGDLLHQSFDEGYKHGWNLGWHTATDDVLFRATAHVSATMH